MDGPRFDYEKVAPDTIDYICQAADSVIALVGIARTQKVGSKVRSVSAQVAVNSPALMTAKPDSLPIIVVNKPLYSRTQRSSWSHEILYGMQDPALSCQILVLRGLQKRALYSTIMTDHQRPLTEAEGQAVLQDLSSITKWSSRSD